MDNQTKLLIFRSQTRNVRDLQSGMRQLHRSINAALRENDAPATTALTKAHALLFCAWAEANFSKVLHTPYGFDADEIREVQAAKARGIQEAWKKCVALGLRHLDARRGNFRPNAHQKLDKAIDDHVYDPSLLRNKLAHGQWTIALNRTNNAVNQDLTDKIENLDVIKIEGWFKAHEVLARAVETLIESPKKAFMRDWYQFVVDLENEMIAAKLRTIDEHVARLKAKGASRNEAAHRGSA